MPVSNRKELNAAEIDAEVAAEEAAKQTIRPAMRGAARDAGRLTDEEILQKYAGEFKDEFAVDNSLIPPGMVYAWKALDGVLGRPDPAGHARILRAGFRPVDSSRHPGIWTAPGYSGPIVHKGLTLCEMDATEDYNRRRYFYLSAKNQVKDKMAQLRDVPSGEFRRDHPAVQPRISSGTFEPVPNPEFE